MLLLSLGTIVKTDAAKTIAAFQGFSDEHQLGVRVPQLMQKLQPLFIDFNLAKISVVDFKQAVSDVFFENARYKGDQLLEKFLAEFEDAWNIMCQVDESVISLLKMIAEAKNRAVNIVIYCDTNLLHLLYIKSIIARNSFDCPRIEATCERQIRKDELLEAIVSDTTGELITVVLGSTEKISDAVLLEMTRARDVRVESVASHMGVKIERLPGSSLDIELLEQYLGIQQSTQQENQLLSNEQSMRDFFESLSSEVEQMKRASENAFEVPPQQTFLPQVEQQTSRIAGTQEDAKAKIVESPSFQFE